MKILYSCNFYVGGTSGKSRATEQKLSALSNIGAKVIRVTPLFKNKFFTLLSLPCMELLLSIHLLLGKYDTFISRGSVGYFAIFIAHLKGISTVREIHADAIEELDLLPYTGAKLYIIKLLSKLSAFIDNKSEIRIFNHSFLMNSYHKTNGMRNADAFVYNGYSTESRTLLTKDEARKYFSFDDDKYYLVFTGSVSKWHGVEYLVSLKNEFNMNKDNIVIICGGGKVNDLFDPEGILQNITPMSSKDCSILSKASDLCLLPVKNNRVSPGNPLKLYDYVLNGAWVASQSEMLGYSDEVLKYNLGLTVDFTNPKKARELIVDFLHKKHHKTRGHIVDLSWEKRMNEWLDIIKSKKN